MQDTTASRTSLGREMAAGAQEILCCCTLCPATPCFPSLCPAITCTVPWQPCYPLQLLVLCCPGFCSGTLPACQCTTSSACWCKSARDNYWFLLQQNCNTLNVQNGKGFPQCTAGFKHDIICSPIVINGTKILIRIPPTIELHCFSVPFSLLQNCGVSSEYFEML